MTKSQERTVESICEELCKPSLAKKLPETWAPNQEEHAEMQDTLQDLTSHFNDTYTAAALARIWNFTAKVMCSGIQKYAGDIKQEIAKWPPDYNAYVSYRTLEGDKDAPRAHMPAFVALFNYYRAVYYSNTETFELTATPLDLYKRHHDIYCYVQMMTWVLRHHIHAYHRIMKTVANSMKKLLARGSTDTLQKVCVKMEAISLM